MSDHKNKGQAMDNFESWLQNATFSKESRAHNVASIIKQGIIQGYWKPGTPINDLELSKQLGVSRTSVREALSRLVETRIVSRVHWKGFYVRELHWNDVESIFEIRMSLEKLAFSKALLFITDKDLLDLELFINQSEEKLREDDKEGFMRTDPLFHNKIYQISGNEWIPYILNNSLILLDILRHMDKQDDFTSAAADSIKQHREILENLKNKEQQGVLQSLERHINSHKQRLHNQYAHYSLESSSDNTIAYTE